MWIRKTSQWGEQNMTIRWFHDNWWPIGQDELWEFFADFWEFQTKRKLVRISQPVPQMWFQSRSHRDMMAPLFGWGFCENLLMQLEKKPHLALEILNRGKTLIYWTLVALIYWTLVALIYWSLVAFINLHISPITTQTWQMCVHAARCCPLAWWSEPTCWKL